MRYSKFSFVFLILFSISFISGLTAIQDSLDVSVIKELNQPGEVYLTITGATSGDYNIYTLTSVKLLPESSFFLDSSTNKIKVFVYPKEELSLLGSTSYSFSYILKNTDTDEDYTNKMTVRVASVQDAFEISSDSNSPDSEKITFFVRNREDINLKNLKIKFNSVFFNFEETFDLDAKGRKDFSVSIDKDKLKKIEAGSYIVNAEIMTSKGWRTLEGRVFLGEKKGIETKENAEGFFIRNTEVSRVNYGNVNEFVLVEVNRNIFSRLFTSFDIVPDNVKREGTKITYSWSRRLGPSESFIVTAKTNYIYPILIIVAIILIVLGFKKYMDMKLEIRKSVVPVRTNEGKFALKVRINIIAKKRAENISVIDRIPGLVHVHEKFESLFKPTKIDTKNRRIQWDLGEMNAGDERVLSYVIYSEVGVVGKFGLPKAIAIFEKNGNVHEIESNSVFFLAEQMARD